MKKNAKIGLSFLGTVAILIVAVFCFEYFPKNAFALGIKIGEVNIGGLSKTEAEEKLKLEINKFLQKNITFNFTDEQNSRLKEIKIQEIGINFDIKESLKNPFFVGKNTKGKGKLEVFFQNLKEKIAALLKKRQFPLSVEISDESFDKFLTENFGEFEILPKNAEIIFDEKTLNFKTKKPEEGMLFNKEKNEEKIKKSAEFLKINNVYLALQKSQPEINQDQATTAAKKAKEIIESGRYILLANKKTFTIEKKTLGNWFFFLPKREGSTTILSVSLDEELIKNHLEEISSAVNIEAKNPILSFDGGKIKIILPPETGKILNIEKSSKEIQNKILARKNKITLSFDKKEPKITENKIKELQIEKLISSGSSNFSGSSKSRINNIKVGSSKFNGILIEPNEEFSFNKILGEVGPKQGYLPELVIKKNKTVPEYGGGLCQVSTTMFRAAVNSGMEITARTPHAYAVKYYYPQGFDATIYLPFPDLKFKNNTGAHILIQSKIKGNNLAFEFFGKEDGRKVIIKGPYQYDIKEDGSMKARLEEEVWRKGKLIFKKTFLSYYKSPKLYPVERNDSE